MHIHLSTTLYLLPYGITLQCVAMFGIIFQLREGSFNICDMRIDYNYHCYSLHIITFTVLIFRLVLKLTSKLLGDFRNTAFILYLEFGWETLHDRSVKGILHVLVMTG